MKLMNKIFLTASAIFCGVLMANAETCLEKDENKICFAGRIAGALQMTSADQGTGSASKTTTVTLGILTTSIQLKPNEGWTTTATFKVNGDLGVTEYRFGANKEALTLLAGRKSIEDAGGGIGTLVKGQTYTTELGSTTFASYRQTLLDNDNLALEYKLSENMLIRAGVSDTTFIETNATPPSATNPQGEYRVESDKKSGGVFWGMATDTLQLAAEIEIAHYGDASIVADADVPAGIPLKNRDTGNHLGVGVQFGINAVTPFLNVDSYNDGNHTATGINPGVDVTLTEKLGLTVALEFYQTGVSGSDGQNSIYAGVIAGLFGDVNLGGQLRTTSGDVEGTEITIEFNTYF